MKYFLPDFLSAVLLCVLNRQMLRPLLHCAEPFTESSVQKIPARAQQRSSDYYP